MNVRAVGGLGWGGGGVWGSCSHTRWWAAQGADGSPADWGRFSNALSLSLSLAPSVHRCGVPTARPRDPSEPLSSGKTDVEVLRCYAI